MGVEAAGIGGGDGVDGGGGGRDQPIGGALSGGAEVLLDLGEGQLDRVEVGGIGRQEEPWQPAPSISRRARALLWTGRLSKTTIWPGTKVGTNSCST